MPYYHMMDWYPYMGFWMSLIWLVVLISIAYVIYRLIKSDKNVVPNKTLSAKGILDERYAKGELTREQYMQIKEDLNKVR